MSYNPVTGQWARIEEASKMEEEEEKEKIRDENEKGKDKEREKEKEKDGDDMDIAIETVRLLFVHSFLLYLISL